MVAFRVIFSMAQNKVVSFGKYRGKVLGSLPDNYLHWMSRELENEWKPAAMEVLEQRKKSNGSNLNGSSPDSNRGSEGSSAIVTFGKYKGQPIHTLPEEYLKWMAKEMHSSWSTSAQVVLNKRSSSSSSGSSKNATFTSDDLLKQQIKRCGSLAEARQIYQRLLESPRHCSERYIANLVIGMFGKFGSVDDAWKAFESILDPNIFSFNTMLQAYVENGCIREAEMLFEGMEQRSIVSWNIMLSAIAEKRKMQEVESFFEGMPEKDVVSWTTLLSAYANNGRMDQAKCIFDSMEETNAVTWNAMVQGYAQNGDMQAARDWFERMPHERTPASWNVLIAAYGREQDLEEARSIFDRTPHKLKNQVTWNAMLAVYAQNGHVDQAEEIFKKMPSKDHISWTCLLQGYCLKGEIEKACGILQRMRYPETLVHRTMMVEAYSRAGNVQEARKMFDKIEDPDCAALNAMLAAYAQNGCHNQATSLFRQAKKLDTISRNIMISVFACSGCCDEARSVFEEIEHKDVYSYTTLIAGYAQNGLGHEALATFHEMVLEGILPNRATMVAVLLPSAYRSRLATNLEKLVKSELERSLWLFRSISTDFHMSPTIEHYDCAVGMLGASRKLSEAMELITNMPYEADSRIWMTLLSSCRMKSDVEYGKVAAEEIWALDPQNAAPYVMLADIYASLGDKKKMAAIKKLMRDRGLSKAPAWSTIEIGDKVSKFCVGDTPSKEVRSELLKLMRELNEKGLYEPEQLSCREYHSEKLAIAHGLVLKSPLVTVVNGNLRMCGDCHAFAKSVSQIVGAKVTVRDIQCVHRFENGSCSCQDTW